MGILLEKRSVEGQNICIAPPPGVSISPISGTAAVIKSHASPASGGHLHTVAKRTVQPPEGSRLHSEGEKVKSEGAAGRGRIIVAGAGDSVYDILAELDC